MPRIRVLMVVLLLVSVPAHAAMSTDELNALALKDPCAAVDVRMRQGLPGFNQPYPLPARVAPAPNDKMVRIPEQPVPTGNQRPSCPC